MLPGSIEPGKFYDFIGDKEAFNDLGLEEGEVRIMIIRMIMAMTMVFNDLCLKEGEVSVLNEKAGIRAKKHLNFEKNGFL